jgi:methyltransferase
VTFAAILLGFVTLQRCGELVLAHKNTKGLLNRGGLETGAGHYPWLVAMHGAWLVSLWMWGDRQPVNLSGLGVFVVLQVLRIWVIATLGPRWTTRIIVLPGAQLMTTGPYRFLSHPNYVVVACEIAVLPLTLGLPLIALIYTALNALILAIRIHAENRALAKQCGEL